MSELKPENVKILVEGEPIPEHYGIISVRVVRTINKISKAEIEIDDGGTQNEDYEVGNSKLFRQGKEIEIQFGDIDKYETAFKGIIIEQGLSISNNSSKIMLECKDEAVRMTIARKNKIFVEKTDSQVINEIIQQYSQLKVEVEDTDYVYKELVQHYCSDWDYILMRCQINSLLLSTFDGTVKIIKPQGDPPTTYTVNHQTGIQKFQAKVDARNQISKIRGNYWDSDTQEVVEMESTAVEEINSGGKAVSWQELSDVFSDDEHIFQTSGQYTPEVMKEAITAKHNYSNLSKVQGKIRIVANFETLKVMPGDAILIEDLADDYNGKVFVGGVEQYIDASGFWYTELHLGMPMNNHAEQMSNITAPHASGMISPVQGLMIGKVIQVHEDNEGRFRIKVKLPLLQNDNHHVWARISTFYANEEMGSFFLPEVDSEVILGFLNEDPTDAVILGSVHSKVMKPPLEHIEENDEKAIVTREKMRIYFNDNTDKLQIRIETPDDISYMEFHGADETITIEDKHKNKIFMHKDGIEVYTPKDLIIKADQNISMEAGQNIDIKAGQNISGEAGPSMTLKSKAEFSAESANSTIKGSALTTIEGGLVKIN